VRTDQQNLPDLLERSPHFVQRISAAEWEQQRTDCIRLYQTNQAPAPVELTPAKTIMTRSASAANVSAAPSFSLTNPFGGLFK
jgi:hypothetical protein